MHLCLHTAGCLSGGLGHTAFQERECHEFRLHGAVTDMFVKNVSWTRQKHDLPFPKRRLRFILSNDEKYALDGSFSQAPLPHAVGTGLWLQRIVEWEKLEFV